MSPGVPAGVGDESNENLGLVRSPGWSGKELPRISAVVSTYGRSFYLADLFARLTDQDFGPGTYEVILVDNGSADGTWPLLVELVGLCRVPASAIRLRHNRGPGGGRNAGVKYARAPFIAFTDDDCLPSAEWLRGLLGCFDAGAAVVQGRVEPDPGGLAGSGPWDHTVEVGGMTPWFETCNVGYRSEAFHEVGGFDEGDSLTGQAGGRAFGEDALLAARVLASGGARDFAPSALVHHRVVPATYGKVLREWRYFAGFPGLANRSEVVRSSLRYGVFLNDQTVRFDLALASFLTAIVLRRPLLLLGMAPWLRTRYRPALAYSKSPLQAVAWLGRRSALEGVGFVSLLQGSVRHRRVVL